MVERRCAIITTSRPSVVLRKASTRAFSVLGSSAAVGSSSTNIGVWRTMPRAIDNLCFWPTDNFCPLSPIIVLYPSGNWLINSSHWLSLAASLILSIDKFEWGYDMFSSRVPSNKKVSWLDPAVHGRGRRRLNLRGSPDIYELDRAKALAKVAARPGNRIAIAEGLRPSLDDVCMFHNNP